jgi:hypothetical protein
MHGSAKRNNQEELNMKILLDLENVIKSELNFIHFINRRHPTVSPLRELL